jgi:hypothetical protein
MTTTIGNLMFRAAAGILGALTCAALAAAHDDNLQKLGKVSFATTCSAAAQPQFERGVALLHSFWFPEALKAFQAAAQADPACGIAHWGAAVTWLGNPLGGPPTARGLEEGTAAVGRAKAAGAKSPREREWIEAIAVFYQDHDKVDHRTRAVGYEKAMESLSRRYPQDREAAIFYALALNVTLNPADKTYANQLKAAAILEQAFAEQPEHPGVAHYLIHSYELEASQRVDPSRLLGLAGAAAAAEKAGDSAKARLYYERLVALTRTADTERSEVNKARQFLSKS